MSDSDVCMRHTKSDKQQDANKNNIEEQKSISYTMNKQTKDYYTTKNHVIQKIK